jgi:hypothetical protein
LTDPFRYNLKNLRGFSPQSVKELQILGFFPAIASAVMEGRSLSLFSGQGFLTPRPDFFLYHIRWRWKRAGD